MVKDLRKEIVKALEDNKCKCGSNKFYVNYSPEYKNVFCLGCGKVFKFKRDKDDE